MKRLLIATFVLLVIAGASTWWWARGSLPVLDGQLALPGLTVPVEILTDAYGVPSVYSRDPGDVYFAAGVLHARDRLWQMELYRRVTLGRLSEVLGDTTLDLDKRFLTLDLRAAARAEWERAAPGVKAALQRYAEGVNAYQSRLTRRQRPLEFQLLGFMPAPWEPIDSLAVGRLLMWRLAENHQAEYVRAALAAKFGEDAARQLTGRYPASAPTVIDGSLRSTASLSSPRPVGDATSVAASESAAVRPPGKMLAGLEWLAPGARRGNSNNWVLAGSKTKSGRPILANDPHLQIEFPSIWYEMHLVAAGLDVVGVTIPGNPFVALGHNARIAWGMTATGADVQDLVLERVDLGKKQSMSRGSWVPIETVRADIPVRGRSQPVPFEVWKTRNGPIIADDVDAEAPPIWLSPEGRPAEERRAYALRWDASGDLAATFEALNRASDWTTFTAAVSSFTAPSMNIVYADVDGNVGYAMSGRLPVRTSGDGTMPADGNSGSGWSGWIEPAALPRALNPPSGYIASANNDIDRSFSGLITRDWTAPFRASRLRDQLAKAEGVDLDAMAALQNDRRSVAADAILAGLESAIKTGRSRDADIAAAAKLEKLAQWDRLVDARPIVSLYQAFEDALWRRTFVDEMEESLFLKFYEWAGAEKPAGLYSIIDDRQSRWWDDITTVERRETRDEMFLLAVEDAEILLQNEWGGDSRRGWDQVHAARFNHPLGNVAFPFRWLFNRGPVPIEGDGTTLMRVSWNRLEPFAAWEHPSWRQIFDVGQWDESRVAMPAGQSGHPMSPHYFDQNDTWRQGQYRKQPFSRGAVSAAAQHRLLLVP